MTWYKEAACATMSYKVFFDDIEQRQPAHRKSMAIKAALAVCKECPVRRECRDAALHEERDAQWTYGVRGGWTAEKRAQRLGIRVP